MKPILLITAIFLAVSTVAGAGGNKNRDYDRGLAAHYYRDAENWNGNWPEANPVAWTYSDYVYSRTEPLVNHLFIRRGWFSVRWRGYLDTYPRPDHGADEHEYEITIWADDGCRLYIDGQKLIDSWEPTAENDADAERTVTVTLAPGKHRVIIEYFQGESLAEADRDPIKVYWRCPARHIPKQIIPASHWYHKPEDLAPAAD